MSVVSNKRRLVRTEQGTFFINSISNFWSVLLGGNSLSEPPISSVLNRTVIAVEPSFLANKEDRQPESCRPGVLPVVLLAFYGTTMLQSNGRSTSAESVQQINNFRRKTVNQKRAYSDGEVSSGASTRGVDRKYWRSTLAIDSGRGSNSL